MKEAESIATVAVNLQRFGSASKRLLTKLAKITPPSCPKPSLMTQFKVAAKGAVPKPNPMPKPIAYNRDCIDSTPAAVESVLDTI
mmetsp:Transcript_4345/g.7283  ORF Transcript_4345/g.7283 Transcript_4345/m.7283 type:complete len:85 (+) Transcript_4345:395-649(+)